MKNLLFNFVGLQSVLGRKLAEMHKAGKSENGFGFDVDNTIGRYSYVICKSATIIISIYISLSSIRTLVNTQ